MNVCTHAHHNCYFFTHFNDWQCTICTGKVHAGRQRFCNTLLETRTVLLLDSGINNVVGAPLADPLLCHTLGWAGDQPLFYDSSWSASLATVKMRKPSGRLDQRSRAEAWAPPPPPATCTESSPRRGSAPSRTWSTNCPLRWGHRIVCIACFFLFLHIGRGETYEVMPPSPTPFWDRGLAILGRSI